MKELIIHLAYHNIKSMKMTVYKFMEIVFIILEIMKKPIYMEMFQLNQKE